MKYIASCSFGKDSLAMVLLLMEKGYPLDEVVFYDTGMEFKAIYKIRDKAAKIFEANGIRFIELRPQDPFLYNMLERPVMSRKKGAHKGYGWCGGVHRWGTGEKIRALEKYIAGEDVCYIGIAADEPQRLQGLVYPKCAPLSEWGMSEKDCLEYCYSKGFAWEENGIELYSILDRVSCWCCSNKNRKELKNIYLYLPEYWTRLKELQAKIDMPMKRFANRKYGNYGNIFDMETVFTKEIAEQCGGRAYHMDENNTRQQTDSRKGGTRA